MKKLLTAIGAFGISILAFAQDGALETTKPDILTKAQPSPTPVFNGLEMAQMFLALGMVFFLLKWALPRIAAKMNKRLVAKSGANIKLEEAASFGAGSLQVVEVRSKVLLLGVMPTGISFLAELTDEATEADEQAFFEMVDEANERPTDDLRAVVVMPNDRTAEDASKVEIVATPGTTIGESDCRVDPYAIRSRRQQKISEISEHLSEDEVHGVLERLARLTG
ncbi:MAG: flagellar biosynthetic protein FliO [Armatimonadetes bacterium]|nr:flagellar biosynthetic protein FliO [Armatimonadota bacterium]